MSDVFYCPDNSRGTKWDTVYCEEVIINTTLRRGKGVDGDPIRIITQVFLKNGTLIAEFDPIIEEQKLKNNSK